MIASSRSAVCKFCLNSWLGHVPVLIALISSAQVALAIPRAPLPPLPERVSPLNRVDFDGEYRFGWSNAEALTMDFGDLIASWSGYALQRTSAMVPAFVMPALDAAGRTNFACSAGAVRFWYRPYWSSPAVAKDAEPGMEARLAEFVAADGKESTMVWSLQVSKDGSVVSLVGQGDAGPAVLLNADIGWAAGEWHLLTLNYWPKGTALFVDQKLVAKGAGTPVVPPSVAFLTLGSTLAGTSPAGGELDEVYFFECPLTAAEVAFYHTATSEDAKLGPIPITPEEDAARREAAAKRKAERETEGGDEGMMRFAWSGPSANCVTNGPVYLTNVVCALDITNGWTLSFDIAGGTNGVLYDIVSTTNLLGNGITNLIWTWLDVGYTCNTYGYTNQPNAQAFYMLVLPGADVDGDGLYDGWEWKHFGTLEQTAGGDYDGDGINNGLEYTNSTDPNSIYFSVTAAREFVNTNSAALRITMIYGVPSAMAILLDSTNFAASTWTGYATNPSVNLGSVEGWHQVWIGLRGHVADSQPVWRSTRIKLDLTAPSLFLSNPTSTVVSVPIMQLMGFCQEALATFTYDLSNSLGSHTNKQVFVLSQRFNTNAWEFSTNYFQGFDLALAAGTNILTLRASDLAGNATATNLTFVLDYAGKTNPPTITLGWPRPGTRISGDQFTARGWVSDPTAQVIAQIVGTNGVTNTVSGRVGRAGDFWIENVPLASGTNALSLIAVDVVTNSAATNFIVIKSGVTLAIASPQFSQGASGTISDTNYAVWVNGVRATTDGNGAWSVLPRLTLDNSSVQARAIPSSDNGGSGSGPSGDEPNPTSSGAIDVEAAVAWPDGLIYARSMHMQDYEVGGETNGGAAYLDQYNMDWEETAGGTMFQAWTSWYPYSVPPTNTALAVWQPGRWPEVNGTVIKAEYLGNSTPAYSTNQLGFPQLGPWFGHLDYEAYLGWERVSWTDRAQIALVTGGEPGSTEMAVYAISGDASAIGAPSDPDNNDDPSYTSIPPTQVSIGNLGSLDANGFLFTVVQPRAQVDITPRVDSTSYFTATLNAQPYKPRIFLNGQDVTGSNVPVIVGQKISLSCSFPGPLPTNFPPITEWNWTIPGHAVSNYIVSANSGTVYTNFPTANSNAVFYWVNGGSKEVQCRVTVQGNQLSAKCTFDVKRPLPNFYAEVRDRVRVGTNFVRNGEADPGFRLQFGINSNALNAGIAFVYTNAPLKPATSETFGRYFITQIVDAFREQYNVRIGTNCSAEQLDGSGLDNWTPFGTGYKDTDHDEWTDAPGGGLTYASWLTMTGSFSATLMFQPRPYDSSTIPVPMYEVDWNWFGTARTNGPPNSWVFVSGYPTNSVLFPVSGTERFPEWTQNITNSVITITNLPCFDEN